MNIKKYTVLIFCFFSTSQVFAEKKFENLDLYDRGKVLARCAGTFEMQSVIVDELLKDKTTAKVFHEHANGWFLAAVSHNYFSGMGKQLSLVSAQGDKEVRETQLLSGLSQLEEGDINEFENFLNENLERIKYCSSLDAYVVEYQKKLKIESDWYQ